MKVGDTAKHESKIVLIVDMIEKKCWRTSERGKTVDWEKVKPEPHAVVMFDTGAQRTIPTSDLEVLK